MSHLSTLVLHQLRYQELKPAHASAARAHLEGCPSCSQRLQAQEQLRQEFIRAPVPVALQAPTVRRPVWFVAPALVLALSLFLVLQPPQPEVRPKGPAQVQLHLEGHGPIGSGHPIKAGDRLRISVPAGPWTHAWVSDGPNLLGNFALSPDSPTVSPFSIQVQDDPDLEEQLKVILSDQSLSDAQLTSILAGHRMNGVSVTSMALPRVH